MTVKDLIKKIVDNDLDIRIVEMNDKKETITTKGWRIRPHAMEYENIPDDIWDKEINIISLANDGLYILVKA